MCSLITVLFYICLKWNVPHIYNALFIVFLSERRVIWFDRKIVSCRDCRYVELKFNFRSSFTNRTTNTNVNGGKW